MGIHRELALALTFLLGFPLVLSASPSDFYIGGSFLLSAVGENGELLHSAGIAGFSSDENSYDLTSTSGGVIATTSSSQPPHAQQIQWSSSGTVALGDFAFVGGDYSQAIGLYDSSTDRWSGANSGVWVAPVSGLDQEVTSVAPMRDFTVFGGTFTVVEEIMVPAMQANRTATVQNLAILDSDLNWAPLDGWDTEPERSSVQDLAASRDGTELFILSGGILYTWKNNTVAVLDNTDSFAPNSLSTAPDGCFAITYESQRGFDGGTYDISLTFFQTGATSEPSKVLLQSQTSCPSYNIYPEYCSYNSGAFLALPQNDCHSFSFAFVANGVVENTTLSALESVSALYAGDNGSVWAIADSLVYYNSNPSTSTSDFQALDLSTLGITRYVTYDITYNAEDGSLLIYGYDQDSHLNFFIAAEANGADIDLRLLNSGDFGVAGSVSSMAATEGADGGVDVYVGGSFNFVGLGGSQIACIDLAVLRGASLTWEGFYSPFPIHRMAASEKTVFFASSQCAAPGEPLILSSLNTATGGIEELPSLPLNVADASGACITGLAAYNNQVYVGGTFSVELPGNGLVTSGVVVYDVASGLWHSIGIPASVAAPSGQPGYTFDSFAFSLNSGSVHVLMGGYFAFEVGGFSYTSLAKYNSDAGVWESTSALSDSSAVLALSALLDSEEAIIGGSNLSDGGAESTGVVRYNFIDNDIDPVGSLGGKAKAVLLYSSPNAYQVYAGGQLRGGLKRYEQYGSSWESPTNVVITPTGVMLYVGSSSCLLGPSE